MKIFKIILLFLLLAILPSPCYSQLMNQQETALKNFLVRMYKVKPFEGVKVVSDNNNNYLLSVVTLNKKGTASESAMNRIAQVKNARQVSQFLGGLTSIDSETIIRTTENPDSSQSVTEITDIIKEHSVGYAKAMEILTAFDKDETTICYMFISKIEEERK